MPETTTTAHAARATAVALKPTSEVIYIDGSFFSKEDAKISVFDHGFLYGDGVFEGIRLYSGNVFRLKEHLDRLWLSAKAICLDMPMSQDVMTEVVCETCRRNGLENGYIRLIVTRGSGTLGLDPRRCTRPSVVCIASTIQIYPEELYEKGLEIITAGTRRIAPDTFSARAKTLNYLNNIMGKINANNAGVLEALMLNREGYVVEATADNVFLVSNGVLITPPTHIGALRGITRDAVLDVAAELGIPTKEEIFALYEVYTADEMFLTGTAAEVISVRMVDGRVIGSGHQGPITAQIHKRFHELTLVEGVRI